MITQKQELTKKTLRVADAVLLGLSANNVGQPHFERLLECNSSVFWRFFKYVMYKTNETAYEVHIF